MASFHRHNFGMYGGGIPVDLDGYTHTTAREWLAAPMDTGTDGALTDEQAEDLAAQAVEAIEVAEMAISAWSGEDEECP
jgi:hypothetical protein